MAHTTHNQIECKAVASLMFTASLLSATAAADVVIANYNNDTSFHYRVDHMPDLDQKRQGLAGNGNYHCVPTATMNLLMYAANHGFPSVDPGPGFWQAQENHELATVWVWGMGEVMQTSYDPGDPNANPPIGPSGGTGGSNANNGLNIWLQPYDYFVINHHLTAPDYTTNFVNIAKSVIGGNIGTMSYGRYDVLGHIFNSPIVQRNGGHATTITRCFRSGDTMEMWVRDPADSADSITVQSPFFNRLLEVTELTVVLMNNNDPPGVIGVRTMSALEYDPTASRIALIDGHRTIRPKSGYSFSSSLPFATLNMPQNFAGSPQPGQQVPAPFGVILDLALHPQWQELFMVIGGEVPTLQRVNPLTHDATAVPLPSLPALIGIAGNGNTYVATLDNNLRLLTPDLEPGPAVLMPHTIGADYIRFDDSLHGDRPSRVLVSSMQQRKMMFYPPDLSTPTIRDIPTLIPEPLSDFAVEPATGRVWFCTSAAPTLFGVLWDASGNADIEFLNLAAVQNPTGLDFDDLGAMYICSQEQLVVLRRDDGKLWTIDTQSPFHQSQCHGRFTMSRNATNFDPDFHDHPRWTMNIDPDELEFGQPIPDCLGDLAANAVVDVADLLVLLDAWGHCSDCPADLDQDSTVDVADLLLLLANWGPCPE